MSASYTKLKSGEWGIRVVGSAKKGDRVTVAKKDGSTKVETVVQVVWSGNGITLCAVAQSEARQPTGSRGSRDKYPRTGCACGSRDGLFQESDCWSCRHDAE